MKIISAETANRIARKNSGEKLANRIIKDIKKNLISEITIAMHFGRTKLYFTYCWSNKYELDRQTTFVLMNMISKMISDRGYKIISLPVYHELSKTITIGIDWSDVNNDE